MFSEFSGMVMRPMWPETSRTLEVQCRYLSEVLLVLKVLVDSLELIKLCRNNREGPG